MKQWKQVWIAAAFSLTVFYPAAAPAQAADTVIDTRYPSVLSGALQVKVKSFLSEQAAGSTRFGVVVKMYNVAESAVRVPIYELRVKTANGAGYVLKPSGDNSGSVPPASSVELSYYAVVDQGTEAQPTELLWVDVNKDVYPKTETVVLDLPTAGLVWAGAASSVQLPGVPWGDSFTIPRTDSGLTYAPVSLTKQYKGTDNVELLKLLVSNPGSRTEAVPPFIVQGNAAGLTYKATRVDQAAASLDPHDSKYIYYAIPVEADTKLDSLTLLTNETFKQPGRSDAAALLTYAVGRQQIMLPADGKGLEQEKNVPTVSGLNTRIKFDAKSSAVQRQLDVSAADFRLYENKGQGFQTAIVKLRLENKGDRPAPVPSFATELLGAGGASYAGSRQAGVSAEVLPGTAYVVNYSFVLPLDHAGETFTLKFSDVQSAAPLKTALGQVALTAVKSEPDAKVLTLYPYRISIKDENLQMSTAMSASRDYYYTYKLKWNAEIASTENVVTEVNSVKLLFEISGSDGRKVASQAVALNGENAITSGEKTIVFSDSPTDQFDHPVTIHIYETIDTPHGQARRLVGRLVHP